jgi:hypothetical protein
VNYVHLAGRRAANVASVYSTGHIPGIQVDPIGVSSVIYVHLARGRATNIAGDRGAPIGASEWLLPTSWISECPIFGALCGLLQQPLQFSPNSPSQGCIHQLKYPAFYSSLNFFVHSLRLAVPSSRSTGHYLSGYLACPGIRRRQRVSRPI